MRCSLIGPAAALMVALLGALLMVSAGCGEQDLETDPAMQTDRLAGTAWTLALIQRPGGVRVTVPEPDAYTLTFLADDRLVVTADGNRCLGHYSSTGRAVTIGLDCPLATSFPPGSVGGAFLNQLPRSTHFGMTSSGDEMYLESSTHGGTLNFRRLGQPSPPGAVPAPPGTEPGESGAVPEE